MSDRAAEAAFLAALLVLPVAALIARRPAPSRIWLYVGAWLGIFMLGAAIAGQRDRLSAMLRSHSAEGGETRIRMASDGHFWAQVTIDGVSRRMLVDSGATTTALSQATARAADLKDDSPFPVVINTANGQITARTATVERVELGSITTRDLHVVVSPAFGDTDVIGMNFLSRLAAWRVEGRTLVLVPATP